MKFVAHWCFPIPGGLSEGDPTAELWVNDGDDESGPSFFLLELVTPNSRLPQERKIELKPFRFGQFNGSGEALAAAMVAVERFAALFSKPKQEE